MWLGDRDTQIYALQKSMDRCTLYNYQLLKTYNLVNIKSICASLSTDVNLILDVIVQHKRVFFCFFFVFFSHIYFILLLLLSSYFFL